MTSGPATDAPATNPNPDLVILDGFIVRRFRILGTTTWVHQAWGRMDGLFGGPYSTVTSEDGRWWGMVGTERIPADVDALPAGSDERIAAVRAWQKANDERAYDLIERAFPETAHGRRDASEIRLTREPGAD